MAEYFSFFDAVEDADGNYDREYNAEEFTDYFSTLVTTGVMKGELNDLKVTTDGSSMNSILKSGKAFVEAKYYFNDSDLVHTHDTETLGKNRIDRIVVRRDLGTESRSVKSFIKKGVASTNPVPPDLQRDQFIYEISLAQVKIIGGQTYINANDVIDERGKTDICPWAGSKILPNFDNEALEEHIHDYSEHIPYFVVGGTGQPYTLDSDNITELYEGLALCIKVPTDNVGAATLKINGATGSLPFIKKANGRLMNSGMMKKGGIYTIRYNGSDFILQGEGGSGDAQPANVLSGYTFTNDDGDQTGTMTNRGAHIITPTENNIAIPQGYHNGAGYVRGAKLSKYSYTTTSIWIPGASANVKQSLPYTFYAGFTPTQFAVMVLGVKVSNYNSGSFFAFFPEGVGSSAYATMNLQVGSVTPISFSISDANGNSSYISGNYVYIRIGVVSPYSFDPHQVSMTVFAWA